jgi:hypothetical protein
MQFERRLLPKKSQFSIHSPGGGSDRITEMVALNVRVRMHKVVSMEELDRAVTKEEEWKNVRRSFGV